MSENKTNNYDTEFRKLRVLKNPGRISTENDFRLYFQAVLSAQSYTEDDVRELLLGCSDEDIVKLDLYYRQYVETTKDRALRSHNDRRVIGIANLYFQKAEKAKLNFTILND